MTDLPETLELRGSRLKWFGLLVMSLLFVIGGGFLIYDGAGFMGWASTLFFGACCLVFLIQIIRPGRLTLTPEGFEQVISGRTLTCRWDEVSEIGVYGIGVSLLTTNKFVSFSRLQDEGKRVAEINLALVGATAQLSDSFGMKAEDLADLMNAFRARALGLPTPVSLNFIQKLK